MVLHWVVSKNVVFTSGIQNYTSLLVGRIQDLSGTPLSSSGCLINGFHAFSTPRIAAPLQVYKRASSCAWTRHYAPFDVRSLLCTWTGLMNVRFSFVLCWSVFKKEFLPFNTKTDEREPSHTLTSRAEKTQPFLFWNYRVVTHFPLFPINMVTLMSQ